MTAPADTPTEHPPTGSPPARPAAAASGASHTAPGDRVPAAPAKIIDFDQVPEVLAQPPGSEGEQHNRPLLSAALAGTPEVVADVITFAPGFVHHMHRHFHADQVMVPLKGSLVVVDETGEERELRVGQMLVVPRYNWHEARNVSDTECQALHLFGGVGELSEIGFEAWPDSGPGPG